MDNRMIRVNQGWPRGGGGGRRPAVAGVGRHTAVAVAVRRRAAVAASRVTEFVQ